MELPVPYPNQDKYHGTSRRGGGVRCDKLGPAGRKSICWVPIVPIPLRYLLVIVQSMSTCPEDNTAVRINQFVRKNSVCEIKKFGSFVTCSSKHMPMQTTQCNNRNTSSSHSSPLSEQGTGLREIKIRNQHFSFSNSNLFHRLGRGCKMGLRHPPPPSRHCRNLTKSRAACR